MSRPDMNYRIQEDMKCCSNCAEHDVTSDTMGNEEIWCVIYHDKVDPTGICDEFSFDER